MFVGVWFGLWGWWCCGVVGGFVFGGFVVWLCWRVGVVEKCVVEGWGCGGFGLMGFGIVLIVVFFFFDCDLDFSFEFRGFGGFFWFCMKFLDLNGICKGRVLFLGVCNFSFLFV